MTSPSSPCAVLVTGDVVDDFFIYEGRQRRVGPVIRLGTSAHTVEGGAALLANMLAEIANSPGVEGSLVVERGFYQAVLPSPRATGYCVMPPFEQESGSEMHVWRISEALRFSEAPTSSGASSAARATPPTVAKRQDIVVLDDAGLDFRRVPLHRLTLEFRL